MKLRLKTLICITVALAAHSAWAKEASTSDTLASIRGTASQVLAEEGAAKSSTAKAKIRYVFDSLVKSYGVDKRLLVAEALTEFFPKEEHSIIAKRALYYSPLGADQLLQRMSARSGSSISSSVYGVLPTESVYSNGGSTRSFRLPQVEERRRVSSVLVNGSGRIIQLAGDYDADGPGGNPPVAVQVSLGSVDDNGFTIDGQGYSVTAGGTFIGIYLGIQQTGAKTFVLRFKCPKPGGSDPGTGGPTITITCP